MHALEPIGHVIQYQEEVAPADELGVPLEVKVRILTAAHEKLIDGHLVGNLLERLLGISDRKWDQDGARPRRDLVNVEPEPIGKEHYLGRDCRHSVVRVLTEETEVKLGKSVDLGDPAEFEDLFVGADQDWIICGPSRELQ